jgi:hypothetical protein
MPAKPPVEDESYDSPRSDAARFAAWVDAVPLSRLVKQRMAATLQTSTRRVRRKDIEEKVLDELLRGKLEALARPDEDSGEVDHLDARYWVGFKLDSEHDAAHRGDEILFDVRIVLKASRSTRVSKVQRPKARGKPGPKSNEEWIRLAIETVPSRHPNWRSFNLMRRVHYYLRFLKEETNADTTKRGFSPKTFEKFEGEMR